MRLQDYDTTTRYQAAVSENVRISASESDDEVRELTLEIPEHGFDARVGQNIGVLAPGQSEIGQQHHFRLYSVADVPETTAEGHLRAKICVRRCSYIDQYSGEEYPGIASNYLCDLRPGQTLTVTGPYGQAFQLPAEHDANLILICAGTGIAPFRAFVKHIYADHSDFQGRICLFHGGQSGIDLLYRNDEKDDFALYYDRDTFEAINALSTRPGWSDQPDWGSTLRQHAEELSRLLSEPKTSVYLAGLEQILGELDDVLAEIAGSNQTWYDWKADLKAEGRWIELVY